MPKRPGAHAINRLSQLAIDRNKQPGLYADGGGLYLQVAPTGSKSWIFRYMIGGKAEKMGLGPLHSTTVQQARELARRALEQVHAGIDPKTVRNAQRLQRLAELLPPEGGATWEWCCRFYVENVKGPELDNDKHRAQWLSTLEQYTFPKLGKRPIDALTVHDCHAVLQPIWLTINETASRVRGRMEAVLGWAKVKGYRKGDNPALWKGNLEHLLQKPAAVQQGEHHPALPFDKCKAFIDALHDIEASNRKFRRSLAPALALEFLILTVQRTGPIIGATWNEIDFENLVWESPANKMKRDYPHRAPLTHRCVEILTELKAFKSKDSELIFQWHGTGLHATSLLNVVQNMDEKAPNTWVDPKLNGRRISPHGFRSSFMDWAHETGAYDSKALDLALAHAKGDMTEAAYRRLDMLKKRRSIMQDWAQHCGTT